VTDEKIYFILIDKDTLMPTVENVMYNFMNCSQMMFGKMVRYGITYKTSQIGFTVYTRKSFHNYKVTITSENFEGAVGANLSSMGKYAVARKLQLCIHDAITFDKLQEISVPNEAGLEGLETLYMTVSKDETKIGVALGVKKIKEHQEVHELAVYKKVEDLFVLEAICPFEFEETCSQFYFNQNNTSELLFFSTTEVIRFNYLEGR